MFEASGVSGIAGLLAATIQLGIAVSRQIDAISDAPRALSALSTDIKDTSSVLETLQGYIDDEETVRGVLHPSTARDLEVVLKDTIQCLCLLEETLERYTGGRPGVRLGVWKKAKISFKAQEFAELRRQLAVQKMAFRVSVTVANFINTTYEATPEMQNEVCKVKADVASLLLSLERLHRRQGGGRAALWAFISRARIVADIGRKPADRRATKLKQTAQHSGKPCVSRGSTSKGDKAPTKLVGLWSGGGIRASWREYRHRR
ncbi:hypothetical protein CkaCkLH20_05789 [Colletotrichum karsti]|uniref:Fungal N-terminal domain-containing protein n=1 Tax=Colletotrichum karsti TaxID=1095194 RepID=A0A9P6LKN8_9PEZI|nr:uncharacterized protein CkaCkLH20_05789 [Colletotrichum karsti]KAF9876943.1 hypothetical protein CkaCkLH20_05789 [Colletotrichum karsti]